MDQPSILSKSRDLWDQKQASFLKAIELALNKLRLEINLPKQEIDLNRKLYWLMLEAIHELDPEGKIYQTIPSPEACNPPDPSDETRAERELKRPDFLWGYRDNHAELLESAYMAKSFAIECKRLGFPDPRYWVLNENYITKGVQRFIERKHGYASSASSGMMVGYVQTMDLLDILNEVNQHGRNNSVSKIDLSSDGWQPNSISHLGHEFDRQYPITPFYLLHFWVDLRGHCTLITSPSQKNISKRAARASKKKKKKII